MYLSGLSPAGLTIEKTTQVTRDICFPHTRCVCRSSFSKGIYPPPPRVCYGALSGISSFSLILEKNFEKVGICGEKNPSSFTGLLSPPGRVNLLLSPPIPLQRHITQTLSDPICNYSAVSTPLFLFISLHSPYPLPPFHSTIEEDRGLCESKSSQEVTNIF
jgi:hypothetical protein